MKQKNRRKDKYPKYRKWLQTFPVILALLWITGCSPENSDNLTKQIDRTAETMQKQYGGGTILDQEELLPAGKTPGDWIAMTLAFSGRDDDYENYLERLEVYVADQYEAEGYLHQIKATEYHRISLTMLVLGGNPAKISGEKEIIDLIADGTYRFPGGSPGIQGANGLIYGLLTLDSIEAEVPQEAEYNRSKLVEELLSYQKPEGGFCLDPSLTSEVDITAMALQALAPYQEEEKIGVAIEKALLWLSEQMQENGTFVSYGSENAESCAQVLMALCALGMDPEKSELFQKEKNVLEGLQSFRLKDGMYCHVKEKEESDTMATYQSLLALEALQCFRTEGRWIFDFTN